MSLQWCQPRRRDPDEWSEHIHDSEPECLESVESLSEPSLNAERDHLINPRHNHPGPISAESQDLRWFRVDLLRETGGVKPIVQHRRVLPEELIESEIGIDTDRRHRHLALGLAAEQYVRAEKDRIAHADRLTTELAEHDCRARPNEALPI